MRQKTGYRQHRMLSSEFHIPEHLDDDEAYERECAESPGGSFMAPHRVRRRAEIIKRANLKKDGGPIDTGSLD